MNGKRMVVFAVVAAFLIAIAVFLSIALFGSGETAEVILPKQTDGGENDPVSGENSGESVESASVTPETVQAVIRTLERPGSYHRSIETQLFWNEESVKTNAEIWQRGDLIRLDISESGSIKHLILTKDNVYIWYNDETAFQQIESGSREDLLRIADELSAIPGYEAVLELERQDIVDAGYVSLEGKACIFVRAHSENFGYTEEYYIEIETGLLLAAASYDGDTVIYEMKAGATELTAPEDALFCLPGTSQPLIS